MHGFSKMCLGDLEYITNMQLCILYNFSACVVMFIFAVSVFQSNPCMIYNI